MMTFEIALSTPSGIATVYLDDIAEFVCTMETKAVGIEQRAGHDQNHFHARPRLVSARPHNTLLTMSGKTPLQPPVGGNR